MADTQSSQVRVLVLGAGYAGLLAAVRLAGKSAQARVTLVNPTDTLIERVRLHQYAVGQDVRQRAIPDLLKGTRIEFLRGNALHIDTVGRRVLFARESSEVPELPYDYLMLAVGSQTGVDDVVGVREHTYSLNVSGPRSVAHLRSAIRQVGRERGTVVVVGGGPTGIESAAELAETFPELRVVLVTHGDVLPLFPGKPREYVEQRLARMGVELRTRAGITQVRVDSLRTSDRSEIPFDLCLWCGGFEAPELARTSGLSVNDRGQVLVDPYQRSVSHPEVFAVGDASHPAYDLGVPFRMSAFTAMVSGAHAADSLTLMLRGREPQPLRFAYVGLGIALGRKDAVGLSTYPDGYAGSLMLTGGFAARVREMFVRFLLNSVRYERMRPGLFYWLRKERASSSGPAVLRPEGIVAARE